MLCNTQYSPTEETVHCRAKVHYAVLFVRPRLAILHLLLLVILVIAVVIVLVIQFLFPLF